MVRRPLHLEIFTTSLGGLLLEIAYTRVFSFKVFYYFTYLVLGIGLLGIGAGGIALAVSERLRRVETPRLVAGAALFAAASVLCGWFIIAPLEVDIAGQVSSAAEVGKLVLVGLTLTASFFGVGLAISAILSADPARAGSLYAIDLAGAALGCTAAVPLVSAIGPPRMVMLAGLILALGALRAARGSRFLFGAGAALAVALAVPTFRADLLDDPVVARTKQFEEYRKAGLVRYSRWSPVFRVDVVDHPFQPGDLFILFHDGQPGSGLRRFDGNFERFEYLQKDTRALPFDILPRRPKVLIIGAAGGHEVVTSLYFDAEHVTGVELNPVTYGVVTNAFADISGRLAENPRVTYLNGDGRWFLKQTDEKFDLVWFVAPDSYAAMNSGTSGAFVLSESYLYTVEMVEESLKHLTDRGIVCTQFGELAIERKPNRTTRYLTTAREAFRNLGVTDFGRHVALASAPGFPPFVEVAVLLSRSPMTAEQSAAITSRVGRIDKGRVEYLPGDPRPHIPAIQAITTPDAELGAWLARHPYQVDPVRDDSPFFWHFARFRDAVASPLPHDGFVVDHEDTIAEQVTLVFLGVAIFLAALCLLLPLRLLREAFAEMPRKLEAGVYFASLGLGFMFLEVALLQELTLLLGYPTRSLSVTLFGLLLWSGVGSFLSPRWAAAGARGPVALLGALALTVALEQALLPGIVSAFVGSAVPVRIAITLALLAPLGICLGAFMPLGLRLVAGLSVRGREYVAWAWAVNGFFSVVASVLSTILGMVLGFRMLSFVAVLVYAVGVLALRRLQASAPRPAAG